MLSDLVAACYSEIDSTLAYEGGDVGCWEEDESEGEVLDESDVQS